MVDYFSNISREVLLGWITGWPCLYFNISWGPVSTDAILTSLPPYSPVLEVLPSVLAYWARPSSLY